jgi:hypothetical protein
MYVVSFSRIMSSRSPSVASTRVERAADCAADRCSRQPVGGAADISKAVELVLSLKPDLVVLGGTFGDRSVRRTGGGTAGAAAGTAWRVCQSFATTTTIKTCQGRSHAASSWF